MDWPKQVRRGVTATLFMTTAAWVQSAQADALMHETVDAPAVQSVARAANSPYHAARVQVETARPVWNFGASRFSEEAPESATVAPTRQMESEAAARIDPVVPAYAALAPGAGGAPMSTVRPRIEPAPQTASAVPAPVEYFSIPASEPTHPAAYTIAPQPERLAGLMPAAGTAPASTNAAPSTIVVTPSGTNTLLVLPSDTPTSTTLTRDGSVKEMIKEAHDARQNAPKAADAASVPPAPVAVIPAAPEAPALAAAPSAAAPAPAANAAGVPSMPGMPPMPGIADAPTPAVADAAAPAATPAPMVAAATPTAPMPPAPDMPTAAAVPNAPPAALVPPAQAAAPTEMLPPPTAMASAEATPAAPTAAPAAPEAAGMELPPVPATPTVAGEAAANSAAPKLAKKVAQKPAGIPVTAKAPVVTSDSVLQSQQKRMAAESHSREAHAPITLSRESDGDPRLQSDEGIKTHTGVGVSISVRKPSLDANYEINQAFQSLALGDTSTAIATYQRVLDVQPRNTDALFGLATTYHRVGRLDKAKPLYATLLAIAPEHRDGLNNFLMLLGEENPREALNRLHDLETANPNYAPVPAQIAMIEQREGNLPGAVDAMSRAVSRDPDNLKYRYNLAVILDQAGNWNDAAGMYKEVLAAVDRGGKVPSTRDSIQQRLTYLMTRHSS